MVFLKSSGEDWQLAAIPKKLKLKFKTVLHASMKRHKSDDQPLHYPPPPHSRKGAVPLGTIHK